MADPAALGNLLSPVEKFEANLEALRTIMRIMAEGNRPATPDEQAAIAKFSGWGNSAFSEAFPIAGPPTADTPWGRRGRALYDLVSEDEYNAIRNARRTQFFTTPEIVQAMWKALGDMGLRAFPTLRVLEPSAGSGRFLSLQPADLAARSERVAVELEPVTGAMLRALFPNAAVYTTVGDLKVGFQHAPIPDNSMDVAISNVPFGREIITDPAYRTGTDREFVLKSGIHNYFFEEANAPSVGNRVGQNAHALHRGV